MVKAIRVDDAFSLTIEDSVSGVARHVIPGDAVRRQQYEQTAGFCEGAQAVQRKQNHEVQHSSLLSHCRQLLFGSFDFYHVWATEFL